MKKFYAPVCLMLAACTPAHEDLDQWMSQTRAAAKTGAASQAAPLSVWSEPYVAPKSDGSNAFDAGRLKTTPARRNAPGADRIKERLEGYDLESLRYVGLLESNGKVSGYIEADNYVHTVGIGSYIGRNHGRIQRITPDKILLTELIEGEDGNWIYRSAELPMSSSADSKSAPDNQAASE
ncbi:PilP protein [Bergeriella denitrificans]|uniref:PilP protein n=2 Tax=Bergeriella denitrificans TaxID=494 RepID=A0A378UG93_BERDE|nr:PilP protein [Bergeriella denitrificans]